jgi:hypothetical protein
MPANEINFSILQKDHREDTFGTQIILVQKVANGTEYSMHPKCFHFTVLANYHCSMCNEIDKN